jgi:hypothetical protein
MLANVKKNIFKICLCLHNFTSKSLRSLPGFEELFQTPNLKSRNNFDNLNLFFVFIKNLLKDYDQNLSIHFRFSQFIIFWNTQKITKIYFAKNLSKIIFIKFQHLASRLLSIYPTNFQFCFCRFSPKLFLLYICDQILPKVNHWLRWFSIIHLNIYPIKLINLQRLKRLCFYLVWYQLHLDLLHEILRL